MKTWIQKNRALVSLVLFALTMGGFLLGCATLLWTIQDGEVVSRGSADSTTTRIIFSGFFGLFGFIFVYRGCRVIADPSHTYSVSTHQTQQVEIDGKEHSLTTRTGSRTIKLNLSGGFILWLIGFAIMYGGLIAGAFL